MISRRHFSVSLGSLALAGCCTRRYPTASLLAGAPAAMRTASYLASDARKLAAHPVEMEVIDAHAHFFNASDVPVRDFLGQSIAHSQSSPLRELLELLAPLATLLADTAPTAKEEFDSLLAFEQDPRNAGKTLDQAHMQSRWAQRVERENQAAAERVVEVTKNSKFLRRYLEIQDEARPTAKRTGAARSRLNFDDVLATVERHRSKDRRVAPPGNPEAIERARIADGVLGFLFYILSLRSCNLDAHRHAYRDEAIGIRARMAIGALVDFDYWQGCAPASSHDDQIALHQLLSARAGGYMKPLVAYNPWTDIELDGEGLLRVKAAIGTGVFSGVKIYPPSGFTPADNTGFQTSKPQPDPLQLNARLDAFFDYCADEGVVVMAHANHSSGRDDDHDDLSGPREWRKRLMRHNDPSKPLHVNLGHYGGAQYANWTRDFANLMADFPGHRIYADFGFWDALTCRTGGCDEPRHRLLDTLSLAVGDDGETVADRVLYGTDWFMLSRIPEWSAYQGTIFEWLRDEAGVEVAKRLFHDNASRLFA